MSKLTFAQKNDLVVKYKGKKYFGKDLALFQKHFSSNRLMNDLARANDFTFERLDGQMLYLLLDKVSMEEILTNRNQTADSANPPVSPAPLGDDPPVPPDPLSDDPPVPPDPLDDDPPIPPDPLDDDPPIPPDPLDDDPPILSDPLDDDPPILSDLPADEKLEELEARIKALEESNEFNEDEISALRFELDDKDASIEELQSKIEELELKASKKKEDES